MFQAILRQSTVVFDRVERLFSSDRSNRLGAGGLVFLFLGALGVIEAGRQGWLPPSWSQHLSGSHFHAISFVFTVLLILEVIELVLSLPNSVTAAAGKQFEIMSLILIRQSFKELGDLSEPITWAGGGSEAVIKIFSDATGALLIFGLLGLFYKIQNRRHEAESADPRMLSFVAFKKLVALALLLVLVVIGVVVIWDALSQGGGLVGCFRAFYSSFFTSFYTVLIFADVLVVLASLRYSRAYDFAFRYFGFTVATVMIRLALTAPRFIDAAIGVGTVLFALCLIWFDDRLCRFFPHTDADPHEMD